MRNTWRMVSVGVAAAFVISACSSGSSSGGDDDNDVNSSASPTETTAATGATSATSATTGDATPGEAVPASGELFAFGFGYDTGDIIAQTRVDEFREANPDVDLTFSEGGFDSQGFLSALASDDPPDLVNVPRNELGTYVARGVLAPLDECIATHGVNMDDFYEGASSQVIVDGTVYALPEFYNSRIWIFNDAAFEEAGLDPETIDVSDWDALADASVALTRMEDGKVTRLGLDPKLPEFLPIWAHANGVDLISDDGLTAQLDDPAVAEALEYGNSLYEPAGGLTDFLDFRDTWDFFGPGNQYATDQLGGMPMEQWYLNVLAEASPDLEITVRALETRDGEPFTYADGNSWAVTTSAANPEAACAFAASMVSVDSWVAAAQARDDERAESGAPNTGVYTGNAVADEIIFNDIVDLSDQPVFEAAVEVVLDIQQYGFGTPPSPASAEFKAAWEEAANQVLNGEDAAQSLATAQAEAQDAIDSAER